MTSLQEKPFGSWTSPITADSLSSSAAATDISVDNGIVYWCQTVPEEEGRGQIFSQPLGQEPNPKPLLPKEYSCRTRVHEYGGGSFKVKSGLLVFSNDYDRRLYKINLLENDFKIEPVTVENSLLRYADLDIDHQKRFLVCVQEEHFENDKPSEVQNRLIAISLNSGETKVLAEGRDFYAAPRLSPDSSALAYIDWIHPNMPWDYTRLVRAAVEFNDNLTVISQTVVAGEELNESVVQPEFGIDGTLYFASDRSGFWNLYRYVDNKVQLLLPNALEAEFAGPAWGLNGSWYTPFKSDKSKLICTYKDKMAILDTTSKTLTDLQTSINSFAQVRTYTDNGKEIVVVRGGSTVKPSEVVSLTIDPRSPSTPTTYVLAHTKEPILDPSYISLGEEVIFPTTGGKEAYCYFYAPKNPNYTSTGKPPLRLLSHGGPTSNSDNSYSRSIQYWTTRGFAVADVNYGGSTGYGREYRNRLKMEWGVVDVDDCCNAAKYLAEKGYVDGEKLAIEGGSAGGFTTLACIAFRNVFKAGCCLYGVSDIALLAEETHKFESRYPDQLIDKKHYAERSPINSADNIVAPIIFFQGSEDKVVPPSQSKVMVDAMKKKGIPVAYIEYPGESHGFRKAENIKRTMELEQWFYGQIFGFEVHGVEGVEIYNWEKK
ncbi:Dipeptidyl aminopeptidase [Apophysomyces ossiformis]|uniref:Dipeptidyl aminopeptidase n=1 Tax=Apophysomyces ossiformis TaxID=679940 RepID=A0A8H7BMB7_9FUNG|nr:Dipeptidyl aminopeptidase [Apophysomyces ossiformis]